MPIAPRDLALIRESLAEMRQDFAPGSTVFYEKLFARAPQLRPLFRSDLAGQGMKFMSTIATIVDALDNPDLLKTEIDNLAEGHAAIGVEAAHFAPMGEALIDTFRHTEGDDFSAAVEAAWRAAYAEIAEQMIAAGRFGKTAQG